MSGAAHHRPHATTSRGQGGLARRRGRGRRRQQRHGRGGTTVSRRGNGGLLTVNKTATQQQRTLAGVVCASNAGPSSSSSSSSSVRLDASESSPWRGCWCGDSANSAAGRSIAFPSLKARRRLSPSTAADQRGPAAQPAAWAGVLVGLGLECVHDPPPGANGLPLGPAHKKNERAQLRRAQTACGWEGEARSHPSGRWSAEAPRVHAARPG